MNTPILNYKKEHHVDNHKTKENLVLIHGLFGSLENLGMIARLLKPYYTVYSLDLPNHGKSLWTETMTLHSMAKNVTEWMDSIYLENTYFLGHSLGGKVAMEVALSHPNKVKGLIIGDIAPVTYPDRHQAVIEALKAVDLETIKTRREANQAMATFVKDNNVRSFLLKNLENVNDKWQWRLNLQVIENSYQDLIRANRKDKIFDKPTLFINGALSDYVLPEYKEATLSRFPQAEVKIIQEVGHWLHAEKPEIFASTVRRFVDKNAER